MLTDLLPPWLSIAVFAWTLHMVVYHGIALGFEWLDATGRLQHYRVRRPERRGYAALLPRVLFNQCIVLLPSMLLLEWTGLAFVGEPQLDASWFIASLFLMMFGHDVVQYIGHRLMHQRSLLRVLGHHIHHSTGASRAVSACYMSAPDFFLEIVLPYLLPLVLIGGGGSDLLFHIVTMSLGAVGGLYEHSGFDFARSLRGEKSTPARTFIVNLIADKLSSHAHAEHHRRSTVSFSDGFGSSGICDTVFRTRWDLADGAAAPPQGARPVGGESGAAD
jgi:sterol desaturase/sphingolipid hydroxylase (fatty acid hydroxylase superfamily)